MYSTATPFVVAERLHDDDERRGGKPTAATVAGAQAGARASASATAARKESMSARVVPSPMLARTAPGIVTSSPHSASWRSRAVSAASTPSRWATNGWAQNDPAR